MSFQSKRSIKISRNEETSNRFYYINDSLWPIPRLLENQERFSSNYLFNACLKLYACFFTCNGKVIECVSTICKLWSLMLRVDIEETKAEFLRWKHDRNKITALAWLLKSFRSKLSLSIIRRPIDENSRNNVIVGSRAANFTISIIGGNCASKRNKLGARTFVSKPRNDRFSNLRFLAEFNGIASKTVGNSKLYERYSLPTPSKEPEISRTQPKIMNGYRVASFDISDVPTQDILR